MPKLSVGLLKLEGDWNTWIEAAQQAIEVVKHRMEAMQEGEERLEFAYTAHHSRHLPEPMQEGEVMACMGGYRRAA